MSKFSERLRNAIDNSDYRSYAQFARDIGYTTVSLSNVLKGKTEPGRMILAKMIQKLRDNNSFVDTDYLLGIKDKDEMGKMIAFRKMQEDLLKSSSNQTSSQNRLNSGKYKSQQMALSL